MSVIDSWEDKFGDKVNTQEATPRAGKYPYQLNVVYPARITAAKVIVTKRGETSLQLDVELLGGDGETVGKSREWLTLPKQRTDADKPVDTVRRLTFRRRDDLQRILSLGEHSAHAKYSQRLERDGKYVYLDRDGNEMDNEAFRAREKEVNVAVMSTSDQWHEDLPERIDALVGQQFYIVKAPNPRSAEYPYTNVYALKPDNIPLHDAPEAPF